MAATPRARSPSPDAVEIFADSLESLYDHHMPAHGDPLQLYTYRPSDPATKAFTVRLPPQQVNSLFAHHVWNASLRLADLIADGRLPVRGLSVLEMGAGAGIPALMAARAGAEQVSPHLPSRRRRLCSLSPACSPGRPDEIALLNRMLCRSSSRTMTMRPSLRICATTFRWPSRTYPRHGLGPRRMGIPGARSLPCSNYSRTCEIYDGLLQLGAGA